MYAFHIDVPVGVSSLAVAFDFISPPEEGGYTSGASATTELAVLNWNQPAIDFYRSLGATPMDEWTVYRLAGDALTALARNDKRKP